MDEQHREKRARLRELDGQEPERPALVEPGGGPAAATVELGSGYCTALRTPVCPVVTFGALSQDRGCGTRFGLGAGG
jgi:hypothetical protein